MFTLRTPATNRIHRLMFVTDDTEAGAGTAVDEVDTDESTDESDADESTDDGAEALGDKGKQALARMKERLKVANARAAAAERERDEAKGLSEKEKADRERDAAVIAKANDRIVRSEIKRAAKGVLADPDDALAYIDSTQFEVDDDGNVDEDEVAAAIADLVKKKPHFAAQGGSKFKGGADGGARKESAKSLDDQIAEASKAGNHRLAISLKRQKAYADKP